MRRVLAGVGVAAAIFAAGCEHGITLTGQVTVAAGLTSALTEARPALIIVSSDVPKSSVPSYRLAVLCAPSPDDVTLDWSHDGFGCAKQGTVTARLFTADAADVGAACGTATAVGSAPESATQVSEASATVFEGNTGDSGCSNGTDSVTLRLE